MYICFEYLGTCEKYSRLLNNFKMYFLVKFNKKFSKCFSNYKLL